MRKIIVLTLMILSILTLSLAGCGGGSESWQSGSQPNIYVADGLNHRLVGMNDMTGAGWVTLSTGGTGTLQFRSPCGVCVGPDHRIYMIDANNRIILI